MKLLENTTFDQISRQLNGVETNNITETEQNLLSYRLEMYSCKMTAPERKEYKTIAAKLGQNPTKVHSALAPPQLSSSPFGSGTEPPPLIPTENTRVINMDENNKWSELTGVKQNDSNLSLTDMSSMGDSDSNLDNSKEKVTEGDSYTYTASQKTLFHLRSCMTSSFAPDYDFSNTSADEFSREPNFAWVKNHIRQTLMTTLRDNIDSNLVDSMLVAIDEAVKLDEAIVYSYNPQIAGEDDPFSSCLWGFAFLFFNHKLNRLVLVSCSSEMIEDENDRLMLSSDFDDEHIVNDLEVEYYEDEDPDRTAKAIASNMLRRGFSRHRSESTGQKYREAVEKERYSDDKEEEKYEEDKIEKMEDDNNKFRRRTNSSTSKLFRPKDRTNLTDGDKPSFLSSFNNANSNSEMQITIQMN